MPELNAAFFDFVEKHHDDDCTNLLMHREHFPDVDVSLAVQQIEGRREAAYKWPSLAASHHFLFPPKLNREQSSSEATALLKRDLAQNLLDDKNTSIADLTGGMGVDTLMLAQVRNSSVDYVEQQEHLCRLMRHNIMENSHGNITVHNADSMEWLNASDKFFDLIFIDPARRDIKGRKMAAFEHCTPDILAHHKTLRQHCHWLMVKASPMIDITMATKQLGDVAEVHVVAVKGECKELLFICGKECNEPRIFCHNLQPGKEPSLFSFLPSQEASAAPAFDEPHDFLFEPGAALMKAGAFRIVCQQWGIAKLAPNTNLYTGSAPLDYFPGRQFRILQDIKLNKKSVHECLPLGKAHVVTRNFPVAAADLQRRLGLEEGGSLFVIATQSRKGPVGLLCERLMTSY